MPRSTYGPQTFSGKVVLIVAASRGIGSKIGLKYARAGAILTLVALNQAALDESSDSPSARALLSRSLLYRRRTGDEEGQGGDPYHRRSLWASRHPRDSDQLS